MGLAQTVKSICECFLGDAYMMLVFQVRIKTERDSCVMNGFERVSHAPLVRQCDGVGGRDLGPALFGIDVLGFEGPPRGFPLARPSRSTASDD